MMTRLQIKRQSQSPCFSREDNLNPSTMAYYSNLKNVGINVLGADGFPFLQIIIMKTGRIQEKVMDI